MTIHYWVKKQIWNTVSHFPQKMPLPHDTGYAFSALPISTHNALLQCTMRTTEMLHPKTVPKMQRIRQQSTQGTEKPLSKESTFKMALILFFSPLEVVQTITEVSSDQRIINHLCCCKTLAWQHSKEDGWCTLPALTYWEPQIQDLFNEGLMVAPWAEQSSVQLWFWAHQQHHPSQRQPDKCGAHWRNSILCQQGAAAARMDAGTSQEVVFHEDPFHPEGQNSKEGWSHSSQHLFLLTFFIMHTLSHPQTGSSTRKACSRNDFVPKV